MSSGKPIVSYDYYEVRNIVKDAGLLAKPGDFNDFINKLNELINNKKLRIKLGDKARNLALNYDLEQRKYFTVHDAKEDKNESTGTIWRNKKISFDFGRVCCCGCLVRFFMFAKRNRNIGDYLNAIPRPCADLFAAFLDLFIFRLVIVVW